MSMSIKTDFVSVLSSLNDSESIEIIPHGYRKVSRDSHHSANSDAIALIAQQCFDLNEGLGNIPTCQQLVKGLITYETRCYFYNPLQTLVFQLLARLDPTNDIRQPTLSFETETRLIRLNEEEFRFFAIKPLSTKRTQQLLTNPLPDEPIKAILEYLVPPVALDFQDCLSVMGSIIFLADNPLEQAIQFALYNCMMAPAQFQNKNIYEIFDLITQSFFIDEFATFEFFLDKIKGFSQEVKIELLVKYKVLIGGYASVISETLNLVQDIKNSGVHPYQVQLQINGIIDNLIIDINSCLREPLETILKQCANLATNDNLQLLLGSGLNSESSANAIDDYLYRNHKRLSSLNLTLFFTALKSNNGENDGMVAETRIPSMLSVIPHELILWNSLKPNEDKIRTLPNNMRSLCNVKVLRLGDLLVDLAQISYMKIHTLVIYCYLGERFPDAVGLLPNLRNLSINAEFEPNQLSLNQFPETCPSNFRKLVTFELRAHSGFHLSKSWVKTLENLERLVLNKNVLKNTFQFVSFKDMPKLTYLDVRHTGVYLPSQLISRPALSILFLHSANPLTGRDKILLMQAQQRKEKISPYLTELVDHARVLLNPIDEALINSCLISSPTPVVPTRVSSPVPQSDADDVFCTINSPNEG